MAGLEFCDSVAVRCAVCLQCTWDVWQGKVTQRLCKQLKQGHECVHLCRMNGQRFVFGNTTVVQRTSE